MHAGTCSLQYAGQPETADAVAPDAPGEPVSSHVPSVLQKLLKWGNYAGYGTVSGLLSCTNTTAVDITEEAEAADLLWFLQKQFLQHRLWLAYIAAAAAAAAAAAK
jgi:hypothetical protein